MSATIFETARRAVVTALDGRGFIANVGGAASVLTAAHCLMPFHPPSVHAGLIIAPADLHSISANGEDYFVECLFCDVVGDIAALGKPQADASEAARYLALSAAVALAIKPPPVKRSRAWLLSLAYEWKECEVFYDGRILRIEKGAEHIEPGMSGSPIVLDDGSATGVLSAGPPTACGAAIAYGLPGWLMSPPAV
ncbi:trypsin-like peptidase domain-containing protein [Bradyrhizobium tunisiense]|uniref:trypsin-like peptidase domain-containing protein n=1 Tax=Bradyrhizobium tunisiense TaxID=3278709 RepID=UPI0035D635ED